MDESKKEKQISSSRAGVTNIVYTVHLYNGSHWSKTIKYVVVYFRLLMKPQFSYSK